MRGTIARGGICLIFLALLVLEARNECRAKDPNARWEAAYDKALQLHRKNDAAGAQKLADEIRKQNRRLRATVNVILVTSDFFQTSKLFQPPTGGARALAEVEPGTQSVLGKKVVAVTAQPDAQAGDLLEAAGCDSKHMRIVASFFVNLQDTQRIELEIIPDRISQAVKSEKSDGSASAPPSATIVFRPVVSPDGKTIRMDFFDTAKSFQVFKPRALATIVTWGFPGVDDVALGPPQFDLEDRPAALANNLEIPDGGYCLMSRITAVGERETKQSLPVVGKIPLLGKLPLIKDVLLQRKVRKERAQMVVLLRMLIEVGR